MKRKAILVTAIVAVVTVAFLATAQQKTDRIIKTDGTSISGHVDSVDQTNVTVDGHGIARSEVKAILFPGAKGLAPPAQSGTNLTDLVVKRFGGRSYGHVSEVSRLAVVQSGNRLPRSTVAIIVFNVNNPGHVINVVPSPSPSPTPRVSPSPSPSPGSTQSQDSDSSNSSNTDFDLSGIWETSEGEEVELTETKNGPGSATVFAVFTEHNKLPNGGCKFGDRRERYIEGTRAGKKLTGTMWRCTDSEDLFKGCHVASVFKITFKADVISKDQISGTRRSEWWGPGGSGDCKYSRDPSGDRDVPFRITRKVIRP